MAPRRPKLAPSWPQNRSSWPQDRPRWPQDGPSWRQVGPKTAQVGPQTAQVGAKAAQVGAKLAPRPLKLAPRPPKTAQVVPQDRPRPPKLAERLHPRSDPQNCTKTLNLSYKAIRSPEQSLIDSVDRFCDRLGDSNFTYEHLYYHANFDIWSTFVCACLRTGPH